MVTMIPVWTFQLLVMAMFDNRKGVANKILNWSALLTSLVFTFFEGNIFWVIVPLIVVPIFAGVIGGIINGFMIKILGNTDSNECSRTFQLATSRYDETLSFIKLRINHLSNDDLKTLKEYSRGVITTESKRQKALAVNQAKLKAIKTYQNWFEEIMGDSINEHPPKDYDKKGLRKSWGSYIAKLWHSENPEINDLQRFLGNDEESLALDTENMDPDRLDLEYPYYCFNIDGRFSRTLYTTDHDTTEDYDTSDYDTRATYEKLEREYMIKIRTK